MSHQPTVSIPIDDVANNFQAHLNTKGNSRIIFSGKYGTGKSFFLRKFFESRKDKYNMLSISPAKYVVSSNENIFELIKVDIILQLHQNGYIDINKKTPKAKGSVTGFLKGTPKHFINYLVNTSSKIDIPEPLTNTVKNIAVETVKAVMQLESEYVTYMQKIQKDAKIDEEKLKGFVSVQEESTGNIFEQNFITDTIRNTLEKIAGTGETKKENVLVIDDLDRVDPEHIFRILNILSAHNDNWGTQNKFGFDKIILVCDIDNIKEIYEYRYGKVDFDGYIDKFYTADIYRFDNRSAVKTYLNTFPELGLNRDEIEFLAMFLGIFLDQHTITLRQIVKSFSHLTVDDFVLDETDLSQLSFKGVFSSFLDYGKVYFKSKNITFLKTLRLLIAVFGDIRTFRKELNILLGSKAEINNPTGGSALRVLAIPYHLATKTGASRCFLVTGDMGAHLLSQGGIQMKPNSPPTVKLMGGEFTFHLCWHYSDRYSDKLGVCFFEKVQIYETPSSRFRVTHSTLADSITKILNYFEQQGALAKIGVGATL